MKYEIADTYDQMNDIVITVLCSMPNTPRGVYDEEIDVVIRDCHGRYSAAEVRRVAQAELDAHYKAEQLGLSEAEAKELMPGDTKEES